MNNPYRILADMSQFTALANSEFQEIIAKHMNALRQDLFSFALKNTYIKLQPGIYYGTVAMLHDVLLPFAMIKSQGNMVKAAKILSINRNTFRRYYKGHHDEEVQQLISNSKL